MRVSTAFNTMLGIPGASVVGVEFHSTCAVVQLWWRQFRPRCPCG